MIAPLVLFPPHFVPLWIALRLSVGDREREGQRDFKLALKSLPPGQSDPASLAVFRNTYNL